MSSRPNPAPTTTAPPVGQAAPKPVTPAQGTAGQPMPAPMAGAQPQMPGANPGMMPPAVNAQSIQALKSKLNTDFPGAFKSDLDYTAAKSLLLCSQGMRLKLERGKGMIVTTYIPISKKGGLLRPGFLQGNSKVGSKELAVTNLLTNKPFILIKHNASTKLWDVVKEEESKITAGTVKVTQSGDNRSVSFLQGTSEFAKIEFKCPVQKTGMCSSHKPSNLLNINTSGKFKTVTFEENPNGEPCKDDFELNAYYANGPDALELTALIALFEVMAHELH